MRHYRGVRVQDLTVRRLLSEAASAENCTGSKCDEDGDESRAFAQRLDCESREPKFCVRFDRFLQLQGCGAVAGGDKAGDAKVEGRYLQLES